MTAAPERDEGDHGSERSRPGAATGGAGAFVTVLVILVTAFVLVVPLVSATRTLASRQAVDRLADAGALAATTERLVGVAEGRDPAAVDTALAEVRSSVRALREAPGAAAVADEAGPILDRLVVAAERIASTPPGTLGADTVQDARVAARDVAEVYRAMTARGLAGGLRFDGAVLAAVLLVGLLQIALLARMRRLNAGLRSEVERRIAGEQRLRESEGRLRAAADELEHARDAAESANRAKSRFLATMSHEFRTPLNGILGFAYLLEQAAAEPEIDRDRLRTDVGRVRGAGEHMLRIVSDVLDLARIEADMLVTDATTFDPAHLLHEIAAAADATVHANGSRLVVEIGTLGSATTDATRLRQVVDNLLANAARFTENGVVTLRASRRDESLQIEVADTGVGMTESQLEAAFGEFVQVDESITRRHGGTGLGLALVRRLTALLGGHIDATSRPREGSTFTIVVPAILPAGPSSDSRGDSRDDGADPRKTRETPA